MLSDIAVRDDSSARQNHPLQQKVKEQKQETGGVDSSPMHPSKRDYIADKLLVTCGRCSSLKRR
jgi:hypothetical protein